MPPNARVVHGGFQPHGTTYTFDNPQERLDRAGAASLNEDYQQSLAMEQHRIAAEYQRLHYNLTVAKMKAEAAADQAKAEHQMKMEAMKEQAIPQLYAIDPADPKAHEQLAKVLKDWSGLGGDRDFMQHVTHVSGLTEGARKASQGYDERSALQAQKSGDVDDRQQTRMENQKALADQKAAHDKEMLDFRNEAKKAQGPSTAIQTRYQQATNNAANYQKQLDGTQAYIDAIAAKGDKTTPDEDKRLPLLQRSLDTWRGKLDKETATKDALELVHPQLNPAFKTDATDLDPASTNIPTAAPVANGVATPSGEMDTSGSTNGTAVAPPASEANVLPAGLTPVADPTDAPVNPAIAPVVAPAPVSPIIAPNTGAQVTTAETGAPVAAPAADTAPHPFEGQRKLQKSTGKYGTFVNGVFVPES